MKSRPLHSAHGNIHWVIIVGLFIIAVFLGVSMMWQKQELDILQQKVAQQSTTPTTPAPVPSQTLPTVPVVQPTTTKGTVVQVYVSCRREYKDSSNWGDARLLCTDAAGTESVILPSINSKFGMGEGLNVGFVHFVPQGQIVYVRFRGEEDTAQYSLSYYNLRTGATGNLFGSGVIKAGQYVPETSAHYSGNGRFLAVAGGKLLQTYADLQTIYLFDLRNATLSTKISARSNQTFLYEADCFRQLGDINVYFTDDRMTYASYEKPINIVENQDLGVCTYKPNGASITDFTLPR